MSLLSIVICSFVSIQSVSDSGVSGQGSKVRTENTWNLWPETNGWGYGASIIFPHSLKKKKRKARYLRFSISGLLIGPWASADQ